LLYYALSKHANKNKVESFRNLHLETGVPGITLKGRPEMVSIGSPAGAGKKPLLRARAGQTLDDRPEISKTSKTWGGLVNLSSMHKMA